MGFVGIDGAPFGIACLPSRSARKCYFPCSFCMLWFGGPRKKLRFSMDIFFPFRDFRSEYWLRKSQKSALQGRNKLSSSCNRSREHSSMRSWRCQKSFWFKWRKRVSRISTSSKGRGRDRLYSRAWCHRRKVDCWWTYGAYCAWEPTIKGKIHHTRRRKYGQLFEESDHGCGSLNGPSIQQQLELIQNK